MCLLTPYYPNHPPYIQESLLVVALRALKLAIALVSLILQPPGTKEESDRYTILRG